MNDGGIVSESDNFVAELGVFIQTETFCSIARRFFFFVTFNRQCKITIYYKSY